MKILVIEDEIKLAMAIKRALETQAHAVDVAHSGEDGLDMCDTEAYGVIILDLMLPGISGLDVCKRLRSDGVHTPVLLLTAKGQLHDKVVGLDAGADDYLVKPFSFDELFARIRALTRRPAKVESVVLRIANLKLDPQKFLVTRDNQEITLSIKEFALLEYLLRHQNQVISKEQLVAQVWDFDANILPATIEVHMKHLRDKIDAPFSSKLLHTKRGFGYQLKEE